MTDTNPDFGDFDPDDAFDPTASPDPEQVARRLRRLRRRLERADLPDFDNLDRREQDVELAIVTELLEWLRRQGGIR